MQIRCNEEYKTNRQRDRLEKSGIKEMQEMKL